MNHYLRRKLVCERLRIALSTSYRIVGATYGDLIGENVVVKLLNDCRNESQEVLRQMPSDLMTPAEVAAIPDIAESEISERDILNWTKRRRNPVPCFRLNKHTRRIRRSAFLAWISGASRVRRRYD